MDRVAGNATADLTVKARELCNTMRHAAHEYVCERISGITEDSHNESH